MIRTLLIEDEAPLRADLRAQLAAFPEISVVGEAATVRTARELLVAGEYDLVFLDVQLLGGTGFDLVPDVRPGAGVIFATGYDRYAARAFEINAIDYLLKPIAPERLTASLRRFRERASVAEQPAMEVSSPVPLQMDDMIYLRSGSKAYFRPISEISLITSKDNYSEVHLTDGTTAFLRRTMKSWEDALPSASFMRVHRTLIVNLVRVLRFERDRDEHTLLFLEGRDEPVNVSRYRWNDLRARLSNLGMSS